MFARYANMNVHENMTQLRVYDWRKCAWRIRFIHSLQNAQGLPSVICQEKIKNQRRSLISCQKVAHQRRRYCYAKSDTETYSDWNPSPLKRADCRNSPWWTRNWVFVGMKEKLTTKKSDSDGMKSATQPFRFLCASRQLHWKTISAISRLITRTDYSRHPEQRQENTIKIAFDVVIFTYCGPCTKFRGVWSHWK